MRLFLTCMTAACALGVAAPASAQYANPNAGGTVGVDNRLAQLETRIQAGVAAGSIDRTEAWRLRQELRQLQRTYRLYASNGLTVQERIDLQARFRDLRGDIRLADGGATWRDDDRYGDNANVYQGTRYDSRGRIDVNGMYDRNGNRIPDSGLYGSNVYQGQRYDSRGRIDVNGMYDRNGNRIPDFALYGSNVYQGQRYDSRGRIDPNGMYDRNGNRIPDSALYGSNVYQGQRYDSRGRIDANGMYDRNGNRIPDSALYGSNVYQGQRYDSRGRIDPNGMYDRNGNRIPDSALYGSNVYQGQRYDSRGRIDPNGMYDRNGNRIPDDGYYGQGGPYEPVCTPRSGIGGLIDDLFGAEDACGAGTGLRVGSRASANLGAVPYEYRNQYRDGDGYYYRSDGRSIFQIDARTNTIVRIHALNR